MEERGAEGEELEGKLEAREGELEGRVAGREDKWRRTEGYRS